MIVENGEWMMVGVDADDPSCVHSVEELIDLIDRVGFIPLFGGGSIPGFSVEEHTVPDHWFTGDSENDPWEWRMIVTRRRRAAYGKFFGNKAGFVSLSCLPDFVNARREGYDFDARWDDEKASMREKKIMDLFADGNEGAELYSPEIKKRAGFGKGGEKGFEGTLAKLQMQFYLCPIDFRQRINKSGDAFGWSIAVFSTPEHIWGRELVTSAYGKDPKESARSIAEKLRDNYPDITEREMRRIIGTI